MRTSMKLRKNLKFDDLIDVLKANFSKIPEKRSEAHLGINIKDVMMSAFACMYFKDPSLNQFQKRLQDSRHQNNLKNMFGVEHIPSNNRMTEVIDTVSFGVFREIFIDYFKRLQRGKVLDIFKSIGDTYLLCLDGKEYHTSENIHCDDCNQRRQKDGNICFFHSFLGAVIVKPGIKQVVPLMPAEITKQRHKNKQGSELEAAKTFLKDFKIEHPKLKVTILGDSLFSKNTFIKLISSYNLEYLLTVKPGDHKYLFTYMDNSNTSKSMEYIDEKGLNHCFSWENNVPLFAAAESVKTNFCRYVKRNSTGDIAYQCTWVTSHEINHSNVQEIVKSARARWKIENECFNTLTNQGYNVEHNYGHGNENACFNYCLLTLLSFYITQIFELTCKLYQQFRKHFSSKCHMNEVLRSLMSIFIVSSWEALLYYWIYKNETDKMFVVADPP